MSEKTVVQKLLIKPGYKVAVINPPDSYLENWGELPENAQLVGMDALSLDIAQVFVKTLEEVSLHINEWKQNLKPGGILWITYPKGTSKLKTDLNRDILWQHLRKYGLEGVAMVAVDETWSAMRFKIL